MADLLDRRLEEGKHGRYYTVEEVRKLIPQWISEFESQKPR